MLNVSECFFEKLYKTHTRYHYFHVNCKLGFIIPLLIPAALLHTIAFCCIISISAIPWRLHIKRICKLRVNTLWIPWRCACKPQGRHDPNLWNNIVVSVMETYFLGCQLFTVPAWLSWKLDIQKFSLWMFLTNHLHASKGFILHMPMCYGAVKGKGTGPIKRGIWNDQGRQILIQTRVASASWYSFPTLKHMSQSPMGGGE